jgi:hypothetical protein
VQFVVGADGRDRLHAVEFFLPFFNAHTRTPAA